MSIYKRCFLLCTVVTLVLVSGLTAGCQTSGSRTVADMMKVLPEDTDALFILDADGITPVPDLVALWDSVAGEVLPSGSAPLTMGVSARQGNILSVLFLFGQDEIPVAEEGTVEKREFRGLEITTAASFWDSYTLGGVRMVSPIDNTEDIINSFTDNTSTMHDNSGYKNVLGQPFSGIFIIFLDEFSINGVEGAVGLDFNYKVGSDGILTVTGIFDFKSKDNATSIAGALDAFLTEECGVSSLESGQKGATIEISGEIGSVNFNEFMNALTRYI